MLGTIVFLFGAIGLLIFHSYRSERARADRGEPFRPAGKLRWSGTKE